MASHETSAPADPTDSGGADAPGDTTVTQLEPARAASRTAAASRARAASRKAAEAAAKGKRAKTATVARAQARKTLDRDTLRADVAAATGLDPAETARVVDATLRAMHDAMATGHDLDLPPFGKLRIVKTKPGARGPVVVCRVKLGAGGAASGQDPLAKPAE
ncbi:HU family DNA-binding protein [Rhodovulum sp. YNF3179]|uniref:HU family DNA-binding protein n=1 Tax=Rhodovulum sp. YNF3179 TaxID=3425127 RepID=UPI003D32866F